MIPANYINLFRSMPGLMPAMTLINPLGGGMMGLGSRVSFASGPTEVLEMTI